MAKYTTIPIEILRQVLEYNPETGQLFWKHRPTELFKSNGHNSEAAWNTRYAGKLAFVTKLKNRYFVGRIFNIGLRAHRVCWALHYGYWPEEVDHEDHDGFNNRMENLVSGSHVQNTRNQSLRKTNTSGVCGVWRQNQSWVAEIKVDGQKICLGSFASLDEASKIRKAAEVKYGFHLNHGQSQQKSAQS